MQPTGRVRARTAASAVALVLAAGPLAACAAGFGATTAQPYAPADGVLANSGPLRIQNALVVAAPSVTSGVVVASIANRGSRPDRLIRVTSPGGAVRVTGDTTLDPRSALRLGVGTPAVVTLSGLRRLAGETITLSFQFRRAAPVTLRTVVMPARGYYATITPPATPSASPTLPPPVGASSSPSSG